MFKEKTPVNIRDMQRKKSNVSFAYLLYICCTVTLKNKFCISSSSITVVCGHYSRNKYVVRLSFTVKKALVLAQLLSSTLWWLLSCSVRLSDYGSVMMTSLMTRPER